MREVFRTESKVVAATLLVALGAVACGGKSEANKSVIPKLEAKNEIFLEHKSAEIEYFYNLRRATITPGDLVFEEVCQNHDMILRQLDSETRRPIGGFIVKNARECQDGKISPKDFGELLKPADQDFNTTH